MAESIEERNVLAKERTALALERNNFANERTFLSWIRTGLACVGGGLAIIRLLTFTHVTYQLIAKVCGELLMVVGTAIFLLSLLEYRKNYYKLKSTSTYAGSLLSVTCIASTLIILSLLLLFIS